MLWPLALERMRGAEEGIVWTKKEDDDSIEGAGSNGNKKELRGMARGILTGSSRKLCRETEGNKIDSLSSTDGKDRRKKKILSDQPKPVRLPLYIP